MKEINAINTKKQRYFGRNRSTEMSLENCASESKGGLACVASSLGEGYGPPARRERVNWKYCDTVCRKELFPRCQTDDVCTGSRI